ncbi:hypothetical protein PENTCL1PPCAC_30467, partial [Pristionchus entomophagus]
CLSFREMLHTYKEFSWNPWRTIGTAVLTNTVTRKVLAEIPGFYGNEFKPLMRKLIHVVNDIYDVNAPMREIEEIPSVLVHGDIWQSNIMWSRGSERPRRLQAILDWQSAHVGSPAEDLVYLLVCV